jgi:adenylylsulfate kinase
MATQTVFLNGTVGVGKTMVAAALSELHTGRQILHAVIDIYEMRRMRPSSTGDTFHQGLSMRNLAALTANYRAAGAQELRPLRVRQHREIQRFRRFVLFVGVLNV